MLRLMKFAVMALVAAMLASPANARPPEWVELGTHSVKLLETDDEIKVGRDDGVFTRIRFEVSGNDLDLRDIRVRFINGEEQVIRIDQMIREGRSSPEFDLVGRRRGIQSIFLRYNGRPLFGGKSRIKIMALRSDFDPPPPPPPPPSAGRPKVLDNQVVNSGSDRIDFDVGREDGLVTQIRLRAVDGPLLYRAIEITFANGQTQVVEGIERLEAGEQGKAIDLAGDRRFIRKVTVYKRPSWRPGNSRVELLGLVEPRPAPPSPPPPRPSPPSAGYESLDIETVDRASETIVFRPRRPVPVDQVIIRAIDEPLTFRNVTVAFDNGQSQSFDVIERLEPGQSSRPYDVRGDRRLVSEVVVQKRPSWRPGVGRAELLAKLAPLPPPPPPPPPRPSGPPSHGFPPGWVLISTGNLAPGKSPPPRPFNTACFGKANLPGCGPLGALPSSAVVPVGRDVGQFSRLGFRLIGGDLQIRGITVIYGSGERDSIPLSAKLTNNGRTQPIELRGERFIREIQIDYVKSTLNRSTVEVYGDYADSWLGERGRRRDYNQGWVLLGSQRAEMFSNDVDAFQVGERFGSFRALRFSVRDHDVRFYGMRIVYGNGQTENVPFSGELTSGQSTPPLNLTGRQRYIDRIEVKYRTRLNFKGEGTVEVWGQQ